jgi:hypothetical protein
VRQAVRVCVQHGHVFPFYMLNSFNFAVKAINDSMYTFKTFFCTWNRGIIDVLGSTQNEWTLYIVMKPKFSRSIFDKYSTFFTSWLVTFSVSLIKVHLLSKICVNYQINQIYSSKLRQGTSHKAMKYSISTSTRYLIKNFREKIAKRFYFISSSIEIAFNSK